ncbi:MAG: EscU/YscU/HrcU family type III secretion system export apparatus switch protein [Thermoleophilia bacterium]|nr:EscU/YscU/HrcU family type III secretion system export apparatus switch protein [Thermoleophilia bacterium]
MSGGRAPARRRAVALGYDNERDHAPRVTATGAGSVADRILEAAREHGVPIREDRDLAEALAQLDLWQAIPPELYAVIAEVFAWAYRANREYGRG